MCWVLALACQILVALFGIFHCGMQDKLPTACRIPVPQTGIKLRSPALQSRLWTTGPPGKSQEMFSVGEYCGLRTTDLSVNSRSSWEWGRRGEGFRFFQGQETDGCLKCVRSWAPREYPFLPVPQVSRAEVRKVGFPWRAVPVIP